MTTPANRSLRDRLSSVATWLVNHLAAPVVVALVVAVISAWITSSTVIRALAGEPSQDIALHATGDSSRRCTGFAGTAERDPDFPLWVWARDQRGDYAAKRVDGWAGDGEWQASVTLGGEETENDLAYDVTALYLPRDVSEALRSVQSMSPDNEAWTEYTQIPDAAIKPTSIEYIRPAGNGGLPC